MCAGGSECERTDLLGCCRKLWGEVARLSMAGDGVFIGFVSQQSLQNGLRFSLLQQPAVGLANSHGMVSPSFSYW